MIEVDSVSDRSIKYIKQGWSCDNHVIMNSRLGKPSVRQTCYISCRGHVTCDEHKCIGTKYTM